MRTVSIQKNKDNQVTSAHVNTQLTPELTDKVLHVLCDMKIYITTIFTTRIQVIALTVKPSVSCRIHSCLERVLLFFNLPEILKHALHSPYFLSDTWFNMKITAAVLHHG